MVASSHTMTMIIDLTVIFIEHGFARDQVIVLHLPDKPRSMLRPLYAGIALNTGNFRAKQEHGWNKDCTQEWKSCDQPISMASFHLILTMRRIATAAKACLKASLGTQPMSLR